MRKLFLLVLLVAGISAAGVFSPRPAEASGTCVTYCRPVDACGHICCYEQCCGTRCVILDCAPPQPCGNNN
ncbi:MAG TPA: hypothetical protein VGH73_06200 [Thermoanaerobaculia bacterium]